MLVTEAFLSLGGSKDVGFLNTFSSDLLFSVVLSFDLANEAGSEIYIYNCWNF